MLNFDNLNKFSKTNTSLSARASFFTESATLKASMLARNMILAGKDVIDLGIGEPDFLPPENLRRNVAQNEIIGHKVYGNIEGSRELIESIILKIKRDNGLEYNGTQIFTSDGGKVALDRAIETLIDKDDEVIIPAPCWVSYIPQVKLAGGKAIVVFAGVDQAYKITPQQLENAITERTKLFIFCPLSNPTGMYYTPQEQKALGEVLLKYPHITIITDDIYEHLLFSKHDKFINLINIFPELKSRTLILNGCTKSHSWRFSYMAGPEDIIAAMKKIHSHRSGHPTFAGQAGAIYAFNTGKQPHVVASFEARHAALLPLIQNMPGWRCCTADGAFYVLADIAESLKRTGINDEIEYQAAMLEHAQVSCVPGPAFLAPGCIRLSLVQPLPRLVEALRRIQQWLLKCELANSQIILADQTSFYSMPKSKL